MDRFPVHHPVSEGRRERETFRYDPALIAHSVRNDGNCLIPPSELRSSADPVLTALAELGVLRLKATRALISLFDRNYQYIVAEATPSLPLTPNAEVAHSNAGEHLVLCGTSIPRAAGICELALGIPLSPPPEDPSGTNNMPVTVIPDISLDPMSSERSFCHLAPQNRFYAGVPIRSQKGIDVGVFCVFDEQPREALDDTLVQFIRDLSCSITEYLDSKRKKESHRRADRLVRGVGSFVEGKTTIHDCKTADDATPSDNHTSIEGGFNKVQQHTQLEASGKGSQEQIDSSSPSVLPRLNSLPTGFRPAQRPGPGPIARLNTPTKSMRSVSEFSRTHPHEPKIRRIFSKAANMVREALEVESVLFLDATIISFGGLAISAPRKTKSQGSGKSSSSSSDEREDTPRYRSCTGGDPMRKQVSRILGFSSSSASSINGDPPPRPCSSVPEKFLSKLLDRYPEGKIFNIDGAGEAQSCDVSGDEVAALPSSCGLENTTSKTLEQTKEAEMPRERRPIRFSQQNEGKAIATIFPGARSVAMFPLWDVNKHRWYAGGFVCTKNPTRTFTTEDELSFLRAFGTVIMSEVDRVHSSLVEQSKTDLLNSLSHELRSPLHGIILGAELLYDTSLDAFQGETLVSIENCGRTLLETIDHLLDWSKINNFTGRPSMKSGSGSPDGAPARSLSRRERQGSTQKYGIEAGMMSIMSDVKLDVLAEEVVESVCAGFSFQRLSVAQVLCDKSRVHPGTNDTVHAMRRLDSMQAMEHNVLHLSKDGDLRMSFGDVPVTFDISPAISWAFHAQPGAIRRIIMNLLGNSLKFTTKGIINLSVLRIPPETADHDETTTYTGVKIVVTDTGRGIGQDYLRNNLFTPFSQEDTLVAGTGLGLSLVHQIVSNLGGTIQVWSKVGHGTKVTVVLPLLEASPPSPTGDPSSAGFNEFESLVSELKGLRVRLYGLPTEQEARKAADPDLIKGTLSEGALIANICLDWLRMHVVDSSTDEHVFADIILSTEASVNELLHEQRHGGFATPVVVICRNSLVARRLATSPRFAVKNACVDFISQPIGPRKLAKVLLMSVRRWIRLQSSAIPALSQSSSSFQNTDMPPGDQHHQVGVVSMAERAPISGNGIDALTDLRPEEKEIIEQRQQATQASETSNTLESSEADESKTQQPAETSQNVHGSLPERPKKNSISALSSPQLPNLPRKHGTSGPRFLLVDDNPINLNILAAYMRKLGHRFESASNGQEALDKYEAGLVNSEDQFKVVLMDISMPVMDGFEATRQIRACEKEHRSDRCTIFALTGLASANAQQEAFASGIDLFLTKPVKLKDLSRFLRDRGFS